MRKKYQNKKKDKNKKDIKIKKETIEKKDKENMISKIPINKIKPQSKTITKLINENNNKDMIKTFKKKINNNDDKIFNKKIINKKSLSVKKFKNINNSSINKNNNTNSKIKISNNIFNNNNINNNINVNNKNINNKKANNNISNKKKDINTKTKINTNININKEINTNINIKKNINNIKKKAVSPEIGNPKNIYTNYNIIPTDPNKDTKRSECNSADKNQTEKIKSVFKNTDSEGMPQNTKLIKNNNIKLKIRQQESVLTKINKNINNIINPKNNFVEKKIENFVSFLSENDSEEKHYSPEISLTMNLFKKGNKYIKRYIHMPIYHHYTNDQIIKDFIFKDILSFLLPYEQYMFAKTNKDSLIKYMKIKGCETELILDKYYIQKDKIEKKLNRSNNIKITKKNFFNNQRLIQIFKLLNKEIYLDIFNDKSKTPNDNIIFVYKLFFLLIKDTDKLVQLHNNIFWEKICDFFINNTNEFNQSDLLLGDLINKIMEQKLNFSNDNLKKIYDIINLIDLRQIHPITFSKTSPTTSQFCFIIQYYLEFFGIIENEWSPLENEYVMLEYKIKNLVKKINKIGLYIVNLNYKNDNKNNKDI